MLVGRSEKWLHNGALVASLGSLLVFRFAMPLIRFHYSAVLDSQALFMLGLVACLVLSASLVPGDMGRALNALLGASAWAAGISFIPAHYWPLGQHPAWHYVILGLYFVSAMVVRQMVMWRWAKRFRGKGWRAIQELASGQPLYVRQFADGRLRLLGWRGVPERTQ